MPAKPINRAARLSAQAACLLLGVAVPFCAAPCLGAAPAAKAPLPTVLLYPASPGDVAALVDLRTRLRLDGHVSVLTYDPESAAIQRASAEDSHPEWLLNAPATDSGRMTLARALGASFYAVVSPGRVADTTHVELTETAPAARTFDWTGTNRQFGVRALESQVADAVDHPPSYATAGDLIASALPPAPIAATPISGLVPTPIPAPPISGAVSAPALASPVPTASLPVAPAPVAPVVAAAAPSPAFVETAPAASLPTPAIVAALPAPIAAPMKIVVPMAVRPVPAAPLPLVKTAPLPVAQAVSLPPVSLPPVSLPPVSLPPVSLPPAAVPLSAAVPEPKVADAPLPKVAAAVPVPPLKITLPAPRLSPLPLPVPTPPQVAAVPTLPQVAAVPARPKTVTAAAALPSVAAPLVLPVLVVPSAVIPAPAQVATLPKREIPVPVSALPPPFLPQTVPPARPAPAAVVKKAAAKAEDMTAIEPLLAKGDAALDGGDAVTAIALFRQAINGAPLSVVPRLKLASAYQKDGLSDRALDEARRALEIAPDSASVQQFLSNLDQQTGTTAGALVRDRAALSHDPSSPVAHATLADTLWNNGDLSGAEAEYKAAAALAPPGSHAAQAQLAQLYAAEARYDDCLAILKNGGKGSYAVAIQIVKNRTDTLSSTVEASRDAFAAGRSTREQFYDDAKKLSAEAQALAGFVAQIAPPPAFKLSHLHRMLSTNLLAQETAALVTFIETGDTRQADTISQLEHAAATEMLTAQATEEKLGLWKQKPQLQGSAAE